MRMERKPLTDNILEIEWEMFTEAGNVGGRAACQNERPTFIIMRRAQAEIWSLDTLRSYFDDLQKARQDGLNLMTVKYARMMESTFPGEYEAIKDELPPVSPGARQMAQRIMQHHLEWSKAAKARYPRLFSLGRPLNGSDPASQGRASIGTYLFCELLTYSEATLAHCLADTRKAAAEGVNLSLEILKNTAQHYGFDSLLAIEDALARRK
jgi:hypothetical protein